MRALRANNHDTRATLEDVALPPLQPGDIRVSVAAAGVNPADVMVATGAIRGALDLPPEVGVGYDLAGTVAEVGDAVSDFRVGDRVAGLHEDLAAPVRSHADIATIPATAAAPVPEGLDLVDAASLPLNSLTAAQALDLLGPAEGRSLLVTGAAGGVGGFAVALAARSGWRVTGLARAEDEEFVLRAGAASMVTEVPGPDFDAVLDAAGMQDGALPAVRDHGSIVGVLALVPITPERGVDVQAVRGQADGRRLQELLRLSRDGDLEIRVAGRVALTEAQTAYDKVAGGGQRGRWLLTP